MCTTEDLQVVEIEFDNNDDAHDQVSMLEKQAGGKQVRKIGSQEKMTGVKNAQAEMLLRRLCVHFKKQEEYVVMSNQTQSFKLQHEHKLLNLDKKTNEIVMKKRENPFADYSYDETVVSNLKKYLNSNNAPVCWLQKKNDYKIRTRSLPNVTTPLVAKARDSLRQQAIAKKFQAVKSNMYTFITQKPKESPRPPRTAPNPSTKPLDEEDITLSPEDEQVFKLAIKKSKPRVQIVEDKLPSVDRGESHSAALKAVHDANTGDDNNRLPIMVKVRPSSEAKPNQETVIGERRAHSLLPGLEKHLCGHVEHGHHDNQSDYEENEAMVKKLLSKSGIKVHRKPNAKSPTLQEKLEGNPFLADVLDQQRSMRAQSKFEKPKEKEFIHPALRPEKKPLTNDLLKKEFATIQKRVSSFCDKMHTEIELDRQEDQYYKLRFINWQKQKMRRMRDDYESSDDDDDDLDHELAVPDIFIIRKRRKELRNPTRERGYYKNKFIAAVNKVILRQRQLRPKGKVRQPEFMKRLIAGIADPLMETALRQPKEEKQIRGVPFHAANRSKRHTATYQLQQMVKKMMSTANKFQQQELDKARGGDD